MYGFREIAGHCVDCMTFEEALESAMLWADISGKRQKVIGELKQHFADQNVSRRHIYCWTVTAKDEELGKSKGNFRSNGRAISESE